MQLHKGANLGAFAFQFIITCTLIHERLLEEKQPQGFCIRAEKSNIT